MAVLVPGLLVAATATAELLYGGEKGLGFRDTFAEWPFMTGWFCHFSCWGGIEYGMIWKRRNFQKDDSRVYIICLRLLVARLDVSSHCCLWLRGPKLWVSRDTLY